MEEKNYLGIDFDETAMEYPWVRSLVVNYLEDAPGFLAYVREEETDDGFEECYAIFSNHENAVEAAKEINKVFREKVAANESEVSLYLMKLEKLCYVVCTPLPDSGEPLGIANTNELEKRNTKGNIEDHVLKNKLNIAKNIFSYISECVIWENQDTVDKIHADQLWGMAAFIFNFTESEGELLRSFAENGVPPKAAAEAIAALKESDPDANWSKLDPEDEEGIYYVVGISRLSESSFEISTSYAKLFDGDWIMLSPEGEELENPNRFVPIAYDANRYIFSL